MIDNFSGKNKTVFILKLGISAAIVIHFVLLFLFTAHDNFILIGVAPFYLAYVVFNTVIAFSKNSRTVISLIILLIVLSMTFCAAMFIHAISHGSALISIPITDQLFIVISYTIITVITSIFSLICIFLQKDFRLTNNKKIFD